MEPITHSLPVPDPHTWALECDQVRVSLGVKPRGEPTRGIGGGGVVVDTGEQCMTAAVIVITSPSHNHHPSAVLSHNLRLFPFISNIENQRFESIFEGNSATQDRKLSSDQLLHV